MKQMQKNVKEKIGTRLSTMLRKTSPSRFSFSKGSTGYFIILSIIGILVGIWMLLQGFGGKPITPGIAIILGIFVVIKEILDIFH